MLLYVEETYIHQKKKKKRKFVLDVYCNIKETKTVQASSYAKTQNSNIDVVRSCHLFNSKIEPAAIHNESITHIYLVLFIDTYIINVLFKMQQ